MQEGKQISGLQRVSRTSITAMVFKPCGGSFDRSCAGRKLAARGHSMTLLSTTLHYITLHYMTLLSTTLKLRYTTLHYTTTTTAQLHSTTLHYTPLH